MIISLIKRQKGKNFIQKLENQYISIENLEKIVNKTNNVKLLVDRDNWKYYMENPNETIE